MTNKEDNLSQLVDVFYDAGDFFDGGCSENKVDFYVQKARTIDPQEPVCIVKNWIWLDLNTSPKEAQKISSLGLQAALIKSDFVIKDEAERFDQGDWVKSSYLKELHYNCLFETQHTILYAGWEGNTKNSLIKSNYALLLTTQISSIFNECTRSYITV